MPITKLKDIKEQARRSGVRLPPLSKATIKVMGPRLALGLEITASMIRAYLAARERVALDGTRR